MGDEDDDEDTEVNEDITRKEDKTMLANKRLKEDDKKAEKLGAAAFSHAKKMWKEPDAEPELRDDSEWGAEEDD